MVGQRIHSPLWPTIAKKSFPDPEIGAFRFREPCCVARRPFTDLRCVRSLRLGM